jgi:DNA-binding transcriptional LysR family regulator
MDLDMRKLRYFVAVAEHLHFGRAAAHLHIAQPVLSRQIRMLEQELKLQLFQRDRRGTALTPAGKQLLSDAPNLLASADAVYRRAIRAGRGRKTFTVGFMPGLVVTAAVRALAGRHPDLSIEVMRTSWDDQTQVLRDGRVDVGYVRMPFDQSGLRVEPLLSEPRVAVLPAGHRLAGKDSIQLQDLAGEHLLQNRDAVPEWDEDDPASQDIPRLRTVEEKLEHVATGSGVVVLPLSTATFYPRPDVTHVVIDDIPPNRVVLAWDSARRAPLIQEFVAIAVEYRSTAVFARRQDAFTG